MVGGRVSALQELQLGETHSTAHEKTISSVYGQCVCLHKR